MSKKTLFGYQTHLMHTDLSILADDIDKMIHEIDTNKQYSNLSYKYFGTLRETKEIIRELRDTSGGHGI